MVHKNLIHIDYMYSLVNNKFINRKIIVNGKTKNNLFRVPK